MSVCIIFAVITFNRVSIFLSWYNRRFVGIGMGVAGGISAYCSQSYPLTAGRFLIVDLVVGGIGSRLPLNVDLIISRSGNFG